MNILEKRFGVDQPILVDEIIGLFPSITRQAVYKKIGAAVEAGKLARYDRGVYYLPTETQLGRSVLSARSVAKKRWMESDGDVFGYVSGFNLANEVGMTTQVPATLEITTNKETMRVRDVKPFGGWRRVTLRKPRRPVNKRNVDALRFLDLITVEDVGELEADEFDSLKQLARKAGRTMIYDCSASYPAKTAKKLAECERYRVFA
ncbi:MAG: hypothetical protein Q4C41_03905 [Eggerthellaceae bacterium]|nr:hypothetical protein [Eggerthellaceae bacterium]